MHKIVFFFLEKKKLKKNVFLPNLKFLFGFDWKSEVHIVKKNLLKNSVCACLLEHVHLIGRIRYIEELT